MATVLLLLFFAKLKSDNTTVVEYMLIDDENAVVLKPVEHINLDKFAISNLVCTGMTYDSKNNTFWIGSYGAASIEEEAHPFIVEVSFDFSEVLSILYLDDLTFEGYNLQGVAYNAKDDTFLVANGVNIQNIAKTGELINTIDMGNYTRYATNGVCVDETDGTIWVLFYNNYLVNYTFEGEVIKAIECSYYAQDQICFYKDCVYVAAGADYVGNENYILKYDKAGNEVSEVYQPKECFALEGIIIVDDKLYVVNDGAYHSAAIGYNYVNVYETGNE